MFSQRIFKHIQQNPVSATVKDEYVVEILHKFCEIGISETLSSAQQYQQLNGIKTLLSILTCMQAFELKENQLKLYTMQQKLSKAAQIYPLGTKKVGLNASAAMNMIIKYLEKGTYDNDAQKFYSGIEAAIQYLQEKSDNISASLSRAASSESCSSKYAAPGRFFSPDSANPPPLKYAQIEENMQSKEDSPSFKTADPQG
ncbi:MAG: hypothetical protein K0R12_350 [Gammaproteobacteria bacterium]|jgi:hypothetical protein|nr:hypothetical protein [Gammaproteobacteria bacterium]